MGLAAQGAEGRSVSVTLAVRGIGVLGPGLAGWAIAREVLAGAIPWRDEPLAPPEVRQLPVTERRRVNGTSRFAIAVAEEAMAGLGAGERPPVSAVFASADGDGDVLDQTLAALASPEPTLSPTLFHNSVFNAPVGYWSIATRSTGWATMICAGEGSVAAALLESASQAMASRAPVLCVCVDLGYPERLAGLHALARSFACALVLDADPAVGALATIGIGTGPVHAATERVADPMVSAFARNDAAAAIPLLARIAARKGGAVALPYLGGQSLRVEVVA